MWLHREGARLGPCISLALLGAWQAHCLLPILVGTPLFDVLPSAFRGFWPVAAD